MADSDPQNDARYRPFRAAAYGIHIAVSTVLSLWVIVSVGQSVASMTPERLPAAEPALTFRECLDAAQGLWTDLERKRETLVRTIPASDMDQQWIDFRTDWLKSMREQESRCALGSRERAELRAVFQRLEQVQDLYTIHAVQYAGEVGGAVDSLQEAFSTARKNPAAGRLP